ncbi:MAG: GNVR domain-containing protein [Desulfomonilia bacterium]|jgi:polysaccharide chain length determinant protein (PEP-CTERM system associated)
MEQKRAISIQDLTNALIKKWYWVSMPLVFFILAGIWFFIVLPKAYEATTLILVQPQEIPTSYVQATVSEGAGEQVRTLSQEVLSRSNLESVIKEMNLFALERRRGTPMDVLIASLRRMITITTNEGQRGATSSFTITYRGENQKNVADVTNRLSSYFIDSNLKLRARRASETTEFLQKQLEELKVLLSQEEAKVQEYRNRYLGELPDQLNSNVSTITSLQMRLESLQTSLTEAMNRRLTIQSQLSQAESGTPGTSSQRGIRLADLRNQLEEMRSKYTSDYPEIKRLENQISEFEKHPEKASNVLIDPRVADLKNQLNNATMEVDTIRNDVNRIRAQVEHYQGRVEDTPKREQEIAGLTRDYNITQQNYQKLLDRYYEAKRAEDMEKRQQGEQFRIVDFAVPPQTPVSPDPMRIALIFIALGLGTGAGIIVMLEMLDTTVKGVKQLELWSGNIPCITMIPLAQTESDKRRERLMNIMFLGINGAIFLAGTTIIIISKFSNLVLNLPVPLPF